MIEFDVDMSYLLECDELDKVVLNDENGEHEPMEFVQIATTVGEGMCHNDSEYPSLFFVCSECGCAHKRNRAYVDLPRFCPNCGKRVVGA